MSLPAALILIAQSATADSGAEIYATHCAACHGAAGTGNGPTSQVVMGDIPDLTGYAARSGGALPLARLVAIIEGDAVLRGHGAPMPAFAVLSEGPSAVLDAPDGSPIQTSRQIADLIAYLDTLQR